MTNAETQQGPVPTGMALMALDPTFREDPYPILAELREREPVHYDAARGLIDLGDLAPGTAYTLTGETGCAL